MWWETVLRWVGGLLVVVGVVLWLRTVQTAGLVRLVRLDVYYPEEGHGETEGMDGILRHPISGAELRLGIGLALLHSNWYALVVAVLLPLGFTGWCRLVEEKELIERIPSYVSYRREIPAFWPRPRDLIKFLRFLFTGI